ncbi:hypothetical protein Ahy_A07g036766 [Arachis hypogaea]|uniref:FAR1 domain-containing protein n=1 Tax=Arachis hypogaea TaxID=3818 RepID=A0A445CGY4_ARAHY|nr:hypothetical protein Ahy_A07g036766 [Arachis hypogaea]
MGSRSGVVEGTCQWNVRSRDDWIQRNGVGLDQQEALYDMKTEAEEYFGDYESKDDGRNNGIESDEGVGPDDVLQMKFNTSDEARSFYNNYSLLKGLLRRKGGSRQGYQEKKWVEMTNQKREHKIVTRGCLAKMRIKRKDGSGKWYMPQFVDEPNHELTSGKFVDYLRSHRRISDVEIAQMTSIREVGISIPKIYESFTKQVEGFNLVSQNRTFIIRGLQNRDEALYDMKTEAEEYFGDYESKDDGRNNGIESDEGVGPDDVLQMKFNTSDEARSFYNNYSLLKGLLRRKGGSRQGYQEKKWVEMTNQKREHKIVTRGCLAKMRIKRKDGSGKWYMPQFVDEPNHELTSGKFVDYLRSHRRISDVEIAQMTSIREVGISIPKIYESFTKQVEGFNLVSQNRTFIIRGLQNRDVSTAIRYLKGVSRVDNRMFWRYKVRSENNLCDLFWSEGRNVLTFDATYGRNKYNFPVVLLSGVNHHNQTCLWMCNSPVRNTRVLHLASAIVFRMPGMKGP